jgi:adenylate cyclase
LRGDHAGAVAEARQALTISANLADCHSVLGVTLLYSGHPSEGLGAIRERMRLDPHDPMRYMRLLYVAIAHYLLGEYDASVDAANAAIGFYPNHPLVSRLLAAALGQAGRIDEARSALEYALTGDPNVVAMLRSYKMYVSHYAPWLRREDFDHMLEGLRKAGWEG